MMKLLPAVVNDYIGDSSNLRLNVFHEDLASSTGYIGRRTQYAKTCVCGQARQLLL